MSHASHVDNEITTNNNVILSVIVTNYQLES